MLDKFREKLLSHYAEVQAVDAPHIFKALDELAAHPKAGEKARFRKVYILKENNVGLNPILDYLAGCMFHKGENILVLGRDVMKSLGVNAPNAHVTEEFKAVLAHEMSHAFHGDLKPWGAANRSFLTPLITVIGGIAGAYAVQRIIQKHPHDKKMQEAELEKNKDLLKGADNGSFGAAAKVALYTAGVGLGAASGVFLGRAMRHKMEFRADEYSKMLMGGGEALANALKKLAKPFTRLKGIKVPADATDEILVNALDRSRGAMESFLHPPMKQRIDALVR